MPAPRRPNTSVLVLDRHLTRNSNLIAKERLYEQGGESLLEEDEVKKTQPQRREEIWTGNNGTASSTGQGPLPASDAVLPASPPRPSPLEAAKPNEGAPLPSYVLPSPTLAAQSQSQITYTISVQSAPSATSVPDGGARVEIETISEQNQNKPSVDDAKIEAEVLPGVNQGTSNMGELPKALSPTIAANPKEPSAIPTITVSRPLPGQNQQNPAIGEAAPLPPSSPPPLSPPPLPPPPPPLPLLPPLVSSKTSTLAFSSESTRALMQSTGTSVFLASTTPTQASFTISSNSFDPSLVTSFVTITRSEQGKEESPVTVALSSATLRPATSASASAADNATPQAVAVVQSFSGILTSTIVAAGTAATFTPIALPSNSQDGSILHPTARTLLITFVVLGALSILVAIVVFMMIRSHKKISRAQKSDMANQTPYDASSDRVGVTTHISATSVNENPFLTASEKAIIDRAASSSGDPDAMKQLNFSDAISSFINKSRRLTYKISP